MNKKVIIALVILAVVALAAITMVKKTSRTAPETGVAANQVQNNTVGSVPAAPERTSAVKEFVMTSFVEIVDGQPKPQFSLKEITVNRGERVRIKVTVTKGAHDFKIDEFNVYADTQLNQEAVVEFTADRAGEFVYYCAKPGHRPAGHWGTLKVLAQ